MVDIRTRSSHSEPQSNAHVVTTFNAFQESSARSPFTLSQCQSIGNDNHTDMSPRTQVHVIIDDTVCNTGIGQMLQLQQSRDFPD